MNDYPAQQALIRGLRDPKCYPHAVRSVSLVETHISWVLLAGRYAYKIKKAVDLGFLDYTTLEARRYCCAEEIRLNRRLAPQIYQDVVAIGGSPQRPRLDAQPALEYAVRMRRFPATRLLDRLLQAGKISALHIDRLAATLARFHDTLPPADASAGNVAAIRDAAGQNLASLRALLNDRGDVDTLDALRQATAAAYAACELVLVERRELGFVRECHGDLHLGNIVLIGDEPVPFDGIEFDPDLRWIDVMSEAAFTMMDLLYRGQPRFAWRFINAYLEHTGDYAGVAVLRFYLAYRATVRAKVAAIRSAQSRRAQVKELQQCRSHLALAQRCLAPPRPALIITHGLPGSGKSTLAQLALERLGAIRIRSDVERKRLFGLPALESGRGTAIYSAAATHQTYARLHQLTQQVLAAGFTVIVDAAFLNQAEREQFRQLAQSMQLPFVIASTQASVATMQARIVQRHAQQQDASDADLEVLQTLRAVQQPLTAQELSYTVPFRNDAADELAAAAGWSDLEKSLLL